MLTSQDSASQGDNKVELRAYSNDRLQMSSQAKGPLPPSVDLTSMEEYRVFSEVHESRADSRLRRHIVWPIILIFFITNIFVDVAIVYAYLNDIKLLVAHIISPDQRLITPGVVKTLIGSTVVQLGAISIAIYHYFFRQS